MLPVTHVEEVDVLDGAHHREYDQADKEERPGDSLQLLGDFGQFVLDQYPQEERYHEQGQGDRELEVGDGDSSPHHWSPEEVDPHGGEGKASHRGYEGHGDGQVHVSVEHGGLQEKIDKELIKLPYITHVCRKKELMRKAI